MNTESYRTTRAKIDEIIQLRHDILIVGTDRTSPYFDGDHDEATLHYAAYADDELAACLSIMKSTWDDKPALQLRGMATAPAFRGKGAGKALLIFSEQDATEATGISLFWCNARIAAAPFYERHGWEIVSDEFDIPGVGPHVRMMKIL